MVFVKIKSWWNTGGKERVIKELNSAWHTFAGIFVLQLLASPVINILFNTDLPTIQQLVDVWPVLLLSVYRSAWLTILTVTGLSKYRNKK